MEKNCQQHLQYRSLTCYHLCNYLILCAIGCYLLFNAGMMQIMILPFLPLGEFVLMIGLFSVNYRECYKKASQILMVAPFILWWIYAFSRVFMGYFDHGLWALRDASSVFESLFIILGLSFALHQKNTDKLFKILPIFFLILLCYSLLAPYAAWLSHYSPWITSRQGVRMPVFFIFLNTAMLLIAMAGYSLLFARHWTYLWLLPILFALSYFMKRTVYLQFFSLIVLFALFYRRFLARFALYLLIMIFLFSLFSFVGLERTGLGRQKFSFQTVVNQLVTMTGKVATYDKSNQSYYEGEIAGVSQRLQWWKHIYQKETSTVSSFLFGLGYGIPLTDFHLVKNIQVREPHNSFISMIAREGALGSALWMIMTVSLLVVLLKYLMLCRQNNFTKDARQLFFCLLFFVLIWVNCIGEDALEKPFHAIPYYFLWGVVIGYVYHLREQLMQPDKSHENIIST